MTLHAIHYQFLFLNETIHVLEMSSYDPHLCRHCGQVFKNRSSLRQHELRNENQGTYKCSHGDCKFVAFSKANFDRHKRTHSNVRPFECLNCGKSFKGKYEL